jgi:hypothetical protein
MIRLPRSGFAFDYGKFDQIERTAPPRWEGPAA